MIDCRGMNLAPLGIRTICPLHQHQYTDKNDILQSMLRRYFILGSRRHYDDFDSVHLGTSFKKDDDVTVKSKPESLNTSFAKFLDGAFVSVCRHHMSQMLFPITWEWECGLIRPSRTVSASNTSPAIQDWLIVVSTPIRTEYSDTSQTPTLSECRRVTRINHWQ